MVRPMSNFAATIYRNRYSMEKSPGGPREEWGDTAGRVATSVMKAYMPALVGDVTELIRQRKFMPGGRYLYAAGRKYPQVNNCFLFTVEDSRAGWGSLMDRCTRSLMTGGGIGVVYSRLRPEGSPILGMGGKSTGPLAVMQMVNEIGRHILQGGSRRSAIWAGLHWNHPDCLREDGKDFIHLKEWPEWLKARKELDFNVAACLDGTNISVILDDDFFYAYHDPANRDHGRAMDVYWTTVRSMLRTGEPGFSIDVGENAGEHLRNACTEVTSRDDDDMCNLGSLNLAAFDSEEEFAAAVPLAVAFLLCGTMYSKLPVESMYRTREKNRRLGLGLMGVHEWLLKRGKRYGPDEELGRWLGHYVQSGAHASGFADRQSLSRPVATRAIAPNGTISIVAETTSSAEPIPYVAYKRRYLDGRTWKYQYVVDATADRLIKQGVRPDMIEDSYTLAEDVERRVKMQAWLQQYVDHGISSTVNLPQWGSPLNNDSTVNRFGRTLMDHLPLVRGITAYPDGSRGGQPIVRVPYEDAVTQVGVEFVEHQEEQCKSGICGV